MNFSWLRRPNRPIFFFSSRRRHTRSKRTGVQTCALPISGHEVAAIVTSGNAADAARLLPGHDVAIDFSVPAAVPAHAAACAAAGVPLVEGTTGWHEEERSEERRVGKEGGGGGGGGSVEKG